MDRETFPLQATAMRRQLALLAHETMTTERSLVINAILRLSYDCGRLEAPLPNQARLARITGLNKGDVSRAEKSLIDFRLLRVRFGLDGWRLYEPLPDERAWAGVRWRIADAAERRAVLAEEMWLAAGEGPGAPEQTCLAIHVEPTPAQAFEQALRETEHADARHAAGGHNPTISDASRAAEFLPGELAVPSSSPVPGNRAWAELKASIRTGKSVGQAANAQPAAPPPALAVQPTRRWPGSQQSPPECGERWPDSQHGVGQAANEQPRNAGAVGCTANTALAGQPTRPSRVQYHLSSPISSFPHNPSPFPISAFEPGPKLETGDGARARGRDGEMGDAALWEAIVEVIGDQQAQGWRRWWKRELRPPGRPLAAREALGELKIRLDLAHSGAGEPLDTPGAWFVRKFCELAGIARKGKR